MNFSLAFGGGYAPNDGASFLSAGFMMCVMQAKVPAVIATGVICMLLGGGIGAAVMSYLAPKSEQQVQAAPADEGGKAAPDAKGGDAKGAKGDKGGKGGGGGKGPGPKVQLVQLVGKLDVLTRETLHVELTPDQKKQAKEVLAGLDEQEAITDDEAKAKLEALLKLLEANRKALEAAGFVWPGAPPAGAPPVGGMGAPAPANPFKTGNSADRLKALQATVGK